VREPNIPRPYKVTGYPFVPALFVLAALVLLVFSFIDQPRKSVAGAIVILCGVPIHFFISTKDTASENGDLIYGSKETKAWAKLSH
jgi:APA family basic amino acid/polyamine antiporter